MGDARARAGSMWPSKEVIYSRVRCVRHGRERMTEISSMENREPTVKCVTVRKLGVSGIARLWSNEMSATDAVYLNLCMTFVGINCSQPVRSLV